MSKFLKSTLSLIMVIVFVSCSFASCTKKDEIGDEISFVFEVVYKDGTSEKIDVKTNHTVLAEALLEEKLIDGEEGQYGWFVTSVKGVKYDYTTDGVYWAFYVDGKYSNVGVSSVNVEEGKTYSFKAEQ